MDMLVPQLEYSVCGNHGRFDRDGLLERISRRTGVLPTLLLTAECSSSWTGYADTGADAESGGSGGHPRFLFNRNEFSGYDVPK